MANPCGSRQVAIPYAVPTTQRSASAPRSRLFRLTAARQRAVAGYRSVTNVELWGLYLMGGTARSGWTTKPRSRDRFPMSAASPSTLVQRRARGQGLSQGPTSPPDFRGHLLSGSNRRWPNTTTQCDVDDNDAVSPGCGHVIGVEVGVSGGMGSADLGTSHVCVDQRHAALGVRRTCRAACVMWEGG